MLDKLLTTKYPLGVVLMELATQLGRRAVTLRADWLPRLQNEEADALTNMDFRHFVDENRIHVDLENLDFLVMSDLVASGDCLAELEAFKQKRDKQSTEASAGKRKGVSMRERDWGRKGATLRERDPW